MKLHTVESGVWQETIKTWKIRNVHCRSQNMVRNTQKCVK